jgi:hypothetical protein
VDLGEDIMGQYRRLAGRLFLGLSVAASALALAQPVAAQTAVDASRQSARFCGMGLQGADIVFKTANPSLYRIFSNKPQIAQINNALFAATDTSAWKVGLTKESGGSLVLAHLLTYESVDEQPYTDPRDGLKYIAVAYSVGINTVLIDTFSNTVRAMVPSVISYSERISGVLTPERRFAGFQKLFADTAEPDSATHQWLASLSRFTFSPQETNFTALPILLSPEAQQELENGGGKAFDKGRFVQRITTQQEALMALGLGKPIIPTPIGADGKPLAIAGNKYAAVIPNCFDGGLSLELPAPSFAMQVTIEKLGHKNFQHQLGDGAGDQAGEVFQTEQGYGARYNVKWLAFGEPDVRVLDDQSFGFSRSVRLRQSLNINPNEQYSKLTTNFIREALEAYATQNKDWVKENISSSITDKKLRDPNKITKGWKSIIAQTMGVKPPVKEKDDD